MNDLQRTEEWFKQRLGNLTASKAKDVIRYVKGEIADATASSIENLKFKILAEQLTGIIADEHFTYDARKRMEWGTEQEENAVNAYELATNSMVLMAGYIAHKEIEHLGASPDGLVGDDGLIEIKCPDTTTHLKRMYANVVPDDIKPQMLLQLIVTGRKWCDFVDYDPRLPNTHSLFIKRFEPTEEELETALNKFKKFLDSIEKIKGELAKEHTTDPLAF